MGNYKDAVKRQMDRINAGLAAPLPNYLNDSKPLAEYIPNKNALKKQKMGVGQAVANDIKLLTPEQQEQLYNEFVQPKIRGRYTLERFKTNPTGEALFNTSVFNAPIDVIAERVEQMLPPDKADEAVKRIENVIAPNDPNYPMERKVYYPYADDLRALENGIDPNDPEAAHKREIIKSVSEKLVYVNNEYLAYLDLSDSAAGDENTGYKNLMANINDAETEEFFAAHQNGKLLNKLPHTRSGRNAGSRIDMLDMGPSGNGKLSKEEIDELRELKPKYSNELKDKVDEYMKLMDEVGVENYKNSETTAFDHTGKAVFKGEQGKKLYGFWPLAIIKQNLAKAVKEGNYAEMERLSREYDRVDKLTGKMIDITHTGAGSFIGGNVNSTRPENEWKNPIPLKYAEDYVGHNRVNGMYCLYALCKNTGKTARQILDDPTKVATDIAEDFVKKNSFNKHGTVGAKLAHLRSPGESASMGYSWSSQLSLLDRGLSGVAGLASTDQERKNVIGAIACATGSATNIVNTESAAWRKLSDPADERTDALYAHTILVPAEELDLSKLGQKLTGDDWREQADVDGTIARLKQQGKLDFNAIADRADEVLDAAKQEAANMKGEGTLFSATEYKAATAKAMAKVLRTATPEEKQTPGYKKLREKAITFHNEAMKQRLAFYMNPVEGFTPHYDRAKFGEHNAGDPDPIRDLEDNLRVLTAKKKGWFISSTNSDEHQRMVMAQYKLLLKLKYLRGDEFPENVPQQLRDEIKNADAGFLANEAHSKTYQYCCKKTDYGKDKSFLHDAGTDRYNASVRSLSSIDKLIKGMDLASRAELERRKIQQSVFAKRDNRTWLDANIEDRAARMLYASAIVHKRLSGHDAKRRFEEPHLSQGLDAIKNSPAFRQMVRRNDHKKLGELIAKGQGSLTDAFIKASNEAAQNRNNPEPARMTDDQKREFMRNNVLPQMQ